MSEQAKEPSLEDIISQDPFNELSNLGAPTEPEMDPEEEETSTEEAPLPEIEENDSQEEEDISQEESTEEPSEEQVTLGKEALKTTYKYLVEKGAIIPPSEDFEFSGDEEELNEVLSHTDKVIFDNAVSGVINNLPDDFREAIQYAINGGKSLKDYYEAIKPVDIENVSLDSVSNQRKIIKQYFKTLNPKYTDKKVESLADRLEQSGVLKEEAEEAIAYLRDFEKEQKEAVVQKQKALKEQQERARRDYYNSLQSAIESSEFIAPRRKSKVKNFMFNPIQKDDGVFTDLDRTIKQIQSNPDHYVQLADLLYDYKPNKGFDFDRIIKKGKTSAVTEFQKTLAKQVGSKPTSSVKSANRKDEIPLEELIKQLN